MTPDPVPVLWLRSLLVTAELSQGQAATLLHVDPRTIRRWCNGKRAIPWTAAELLRRLVAESD